MGLFNRQHHPKRITEKPGCLRRDGKEAESFPEKVWVNAKVVTGGMPNKFPPRPALKKLVSGDHSLGGGVSEQPDSWVKARPAMQNIGGAIRGAVVQNQELVILKGLFVDAAQTPFQGGRLILGGQ